MRADWVEGEHHFRDAVLEFGVICHIPAYRDGGLFLDFRHRRIDRPLRHAVIDVGKAHQGPSEKPEDKDIRTASGN